MNVSESKFRQILREEARRVLRESVTSFTPEQIGERVRAIAAEGTFPNPLSEYQKNWGEAATQIKKLSAPLSSINGYKGISALWNQIYNLGALHPYASAALRTTQDLPPKTAPVAKLRAILRSISTGKAFTGAARTNGLPDYDDDFGAVSRLDAAITAAAPEMEKLINSIKYVISFDLAGAMLPTPAAAPAAAAATNWTSYIAKTKGGNDVKVAWEAYAASKGVGSDFMSFARWWQAYKAKNTNTFSGSVLDTIAALKLTTAPAAATSAPVIPGTAASR